MVGAKRPPALVSVNVNDRVSRDFCEFRSKSTAIEALVHISRSATS